MKVISCIGFWTCSKVEPMSFGEKVILKKTSKMAPRLMAKATASTCTPPTPEFELSRGGLWSRALEMRHSVWDMSSPKRNKKAEG